MPWISSGSATMSATVIRGIERAERILEDVLDMAAEALEGRLVQVQHVDRAVGAVKHDRARDPARPRA